MTLAPELCESPEVTGLEETQTVEGSVPVSLSECHVH